ncbi:UDP-N-acetylglucosamine 2-epimerase [Burkholderia diffusa]|uniref:UDP-N-acetylglucosamine 2-epimerase n=1 Tax=Burkholderia diffusa TaxID=488732 RepID=UPI0020C64BFB|nr:UDP-N-acetylglucosamine 2-epimerase [Burkholderia diffusa]
MQPSTRQRKGKTTSIRIREWRLTQTGPSDAHRSEPLGRESFGEPLEHVCHALRELALKRDDIELVYPMHLNPNVSGPVRSILGDLRNVNPIGPREYLPFVYLMSKADALTDPHGTSTTLQGGRRPALVQALDSRLSEQHSPFVLSRRHEQFGVKSISTLEAKPGIQRVRVANTPTVNRMTLATHFPAQHRIDGNAGRRRNSGHRIRIH